MMEFKPITPKDNDLFKRFYPYKNTRNAETSLGNLCCYSFLYKGEYALFEDNLITRIHFDYGKQLCYHKPIGNKSRKEIADIIIEDSQKNGYSLNFIIESPEEVEQLYPDKFQITSNRNLFDYLYLRSDLANLTGKKYQPKRNHINHFEQYPYSFRILNKEDFAKCMQMLDVWRQQEMNISPEFKRDYDDEKKVIEYLFEYFEELDIFGGCLEIDGVMVAFSLGSKITDDTFDTHIEKADRNYQGSYAMINKQMAVHLPENYIYINREEDKGIMGLRQAKLSYHPYQLIEKYVATYIG